MVDWKASDWKTGSIPPKVIPPSKDPFRIRQVRLSRRTVVERPVSRGKARQIHMARKLYVGNLPYDTDEQALQTLFAGAGTVETVSVMRDMATGRARGFAFVEMASDEDAQKANSMLNDQDFGGRNLMVNE